MIVGAIILLALSGVLAFFEQQIRSYKFDVVPIPDHVEARWSPSPLSGRRAPFSRFDVVAL